MLRSGIILVFFLCTLPVHAQNFAVVVKGSTLGYGLDISRPFNESWAARISFNGVSFNYDIRETDVEYETDIDLRTAGLLLDWHPGGWAFRMTAGVYYNGNEARANAQPSSGSFTINDQTYNAADVGSLSGTIDFKAAAPYVGIGFGNAAKKGFKFSIDFGALYQSAPRVDLRTTCSAPAPCAQIENDVQAEQLRLQAEIGDYKWWPVVGFGIGWAF